MGYINVGAIDTGDRDYADFPENAKGTAYYGYPYETWIDIRQPEVLAFMKKRIDLAKAIGCDGVDPDNMDGFEPWSDTGFPLTREDAIAYISALADYTHDTSTPGGRSLLFGQKN